MVLLIWPDDSEQKDIETDIRLHFTLEMKDETRRSLTFLILPDGQTPAIVEENLRANYSLSELQQRREIWQGNEFRATLEGTGYEAFRVETGTEFASIVGASLNKIEILSFKDGFEPTGLAFHFSSGDTVYCIPGMTKGTVTNRLLREWFPAPLVYFEV